MKRLFIITLLLTFFLSSCASSQQTALESMLSSIPAGLAADNIVWFTDLQRIKDLAGVEPDAGFSDYVWREMDHDLYLKRMNLLNGTTDSPFSGGQYLSVWSDTFGFDLFDTTREIWVMELIEANKSRDLFSVMEGDFNKPDIVQKLESVGYTSLDHTWSTYYAIGDDNQTEFSPISMGFYARNQMSRIMVTGDRIIAARSDELLFPLLDAPQNKANTLANSVPYTSIAETLGDVLGAAFVPPSKTGAENTGPDWDRLHDWDLAGIGFTVEDEDLKLIIALHYPDGSASNDIDELSCRMSHYLVAPEMGPDPALLSETFTIGKPEAITDKTGSVLKVELDYKAEEIRLPWYFLITLQQLGFLAIDPTE